MLRNDAIECFREAAIALGRTDDECDFTHEDIYANNMKSNPSVSGSGGLG